MISVISVEISHVKLVQQNSHVCYKILIDTKLETEPVLVDIFVFIHCNDFWMQCSVTGWCAFVVIGFDIHILIKTWKSVDIAWMRVFSVQSALIFASNDFLQRKAKVITKDQHIVIFVSVLMARKLLHWIIHQAVSVIATGFEHLFVESSLDSDYSYSHSDYSSEHTVFIW